MKRITLLLLGLAALVPALGQAEDKIRMEYFGDAYQVVYFGVLEGLFRDGVKTEEVDLILRYADGTEIYEHFIYACPICNATIHALEFYRDRPRFYGLKDHQAPAKFRTFGTGLPESVRARLENDDVEVRLAVVHELVSGWVKARLGSLALSDAQREAIQVELEAGRDRGMLMLRSYQERGPEAVATFAPAFGELKDCAICNAALQMDFNTD